jgi:hypothetical protein
MAEWNKRWRSLHLHRSAVHKKGLLAEPEAHQKIPKVRRGGILQPFADLLF